MNWFNKIAMINVICAAGMIISLIQPTYAATKHGLYDFHIRKNLSVNSSTSSLLNLTQYVDPFVGTQYGGNTFPGATVPFGMVQWSPDNSNSPSGYDFGSNTITGFSMTHLSGAGCPIFGDFPFIAYNGSINQSPVASPSTYSMSFSHSNETASPGYYSVKLNSKIGVQLTATKRTGYGRFSFPIGQASSLLINTGGSLNGDSTSTVQILGNNTVMGSASSGHFCGSKDVYTIYIAAKFNHTFTAYGTWTGTTLHANSDSASGSQTGAYLTFSPGSTVDVKVGISYVSEVNALQNLHAEDPGWSFSNVVHSAQAAWNKDLNRVQVTGGTQNELTNFYTALYHSFLAPTIFSDVNGQYIGFDNRIHNAGSQTQYANFSGWDIYRSEIPLLAFLMPSKTSDMIQSLVRDGEQGGALPKWPVANGYSGVMDGDSADPIIAEAYALGARNFDTNSALSLMIKGATVPGSLANGYQERPGLKQYLSLGYIPSSRGTWATSATLEYAIDDAAIGQFAKALGKPLSIYGPFEQRGQNWQNVINPLTGLAQPRLSDGAFMDNYAPTTHQNFVEGSAYQYRWMVPQDFAGLSAVLGGPKSAVSDLNSFFTQLNAGWDSTNAWMGNEPSITAPYAYDFVGQASGTQNVVRQVVNQLYQPTPGGLAGNDDLGTMSAWYVWAAIGLYPEIPGVPGVALASPLFTQAIVHWDDNQKTLVIEGKGASATSPYVQSLTINNRSYNSAWVPLSQLASDTVSTMSFELGQTPTSFLNGDSMVKNVSSSNSSVSAKAPFKFKPLMPPSLTRGLKTALGYATKSEIQTTPGSTVSFSIGLQGVTDLNGPYHLAINLPSPLQIASLSESVSSSGASSPLQIRVPNTAPSGTYLVQVSFTKAGLSSPSKISPVTVNIVVNGSQNSLFAYYNNVGISSNQDVVNGNYDGGQRSYSLEALGKSGMTTGKVFTAQGATFQWPQYAPGTPDNIVATGQTITFSGSGSALVFIGSSTNGNTEGEGTITYTDGTTQSFQLGFSDWTLGGGGGTIAYGNQVVLKTLYRNNETMGSARENIGTYLFSQSVSIESNKMVESITLPSPTNGGQLHIFLANIVQ